MTPSPKPKPTNGVSPAWSNLPRRKCDNCGKSYKPSRPLRPDQKYGFCRRDCNKQFYKHGAAFIQIRHAMEKELSKSMLPIQAEIRELRALWIETESRVVSLMTRLDELSKRLAIRASR